MCEALEKAFREKLSNMPTEVTFPLTWKVCGVVAPYWIIFLKICACAFWQYFTKYSMDKIDPPNGKKLPPHFLIDHQRVETFCLSRRIEFSALKSWAITVGCIYCLIPKYFTGYEVQSYQLLSTMQGVEWRFNLLN
jgi:hypothetical protein